MKNTNPNDIDAMLKTMQPVFDMLPTAALVRWHGDIDTAETGQGAVAKALSCTLYEIVMARKGRGQVGPTPLGPRPI